MMEARRLIIQVLWGALSPNKFIVQPAQALRVGRGKTVGVSLPNDAGMSQEHFELSWDGQHCRLRDLGSATGTLLDGQKAATGQVFNKSWIRAGSTDFSVFIEGFTPPKEPPPPEARDAAQQHLRVLQSLAAEAPLFAILDAARTPRILELLQESVEEYQSLYEGPQGQALAEVAPYLVSLPPQSRLLESLTLEGWMQNWGIYLTCPSPFLELRRHLRKFLMVEAEDNDHRLYFRFYDPRVLRIFLPTCSARQREEFLGPIHTLAFEQIDDLQHMSILSARKS
ncbi:DUF4123 domain-containing protein [Cystobacter fuscus]|uniref:DUF4123 domain-containing protein n=1 Tax=Cystobacter fuscus TaxID=43 RepID=UPI002B299CC9|nr:DUF4123 domain-containing protein [Cystobacter fuscus]